LYWIVKSQLSLALCLWWIKTLWLLQSIRINMINSFTADVKFSWQVVLEFPVWMSCFPDIVNNPKEPFGISIYRGITALKWLCIPSWTFSVTISDIYWQKRDCFLLSSRQRIVDSSNSSVIVMPLWSGFASNEKGFYQACMPKTRTFCMWNLVIKSIGMFFFHSFSEVFSPDDNRIMFTDGDP